MCFRLLEEVVLKFFHFLSSHFLRGVSFSNSTFRLTPQRKVEVSPSMPE